MNRRNFILSAAAAATYSTHSKAWAVAPSEQKLSRIAIMMYGLNSLVKNNFPPSPARTIDIMDIGELCADRFHVHNVELQSGYFPSTEITWLQDFKKRMDKTKTNVVQINLEFGPGFNMGADSPSGRLAMIDLHRVWIDKAVFLRCERIMVNQGVPSPENKEATIANYKAIVAIAKTKGIKVVSENRPTRPPAPPPGQTAPVAPAGPLPPSYPLLVDILKTSGAYGCCDFMNFANQEEQLQGIAAMLQITSGLLQAGIAFDLSKAVAATRELGYKGIYSIKASSRMPGDPLDNTQKTLDGVLAAM